MGWSVSVLSNERSQPYGRCTRICLHRALERIAALEPWLHWLLRELIPVKHRVLSHSPETHQKLASSAPELCSGVHQKGCDLEGVKGAAPQAFTP